MSLHLSCDGTRFHDREGRRVRAADLEVGDTYTCGTRATFTVVGAPYRDTVHTLRGQEVDVIRVPVRTPAGTGLHDTVSLDSNDKEGRP